MNNGKTAEKKKSASNSRDKPVSTTVEFTEEHDFVTLNIEGGIDEDFEEGELANEEASQVSLNPLVGAEPNQIEQPEAANLNSSTTYSEGSSRDQGMVEINKDKNKFRRQK